SGRGDAGGALPGPPARLVSGRRQADLRGAGGGGRWAPRRLRPERVGREDLVLPHARGAPGRGPGRRRHERRPRGGADRRGGRRGALPLALLWAGRPGRWGRPGGGQGAGARGGGVPAGDRERSGGRRGATAAAVAVVLSTALAARAAGATGAGEASGAPVYTI